MLSLSQIQAIRFGLHGVKALGKYAVKSIIETRNKQENQIFKDFIDFFKSIDLSNFSKKSLTILVQCGGFDSINPNRSLLLEVLDQAYSLGQSYQKETIPDQNSLFDSLSDEEFKKTEIYLDYPDIKPWTHKHLLTIEKESLGFYISGHPLNVCLSEINSFGVSINAITKYINQESFYIIGIISHKMIKLNKKMEYFAIITLEDLTGHIDLPIYASVYEEYQSNLVEEEPIIVKTKVYQKNNDVNQSNDSIRFNIESIQLLSQFREKYVESVHLSLNFNQKLKNKDLHQMQSLFQMYSGETPVIFHLSDTLDNQISIQLKEKINLSSQLIENLQENIESFQINYSYNIN